MDLTSSQSKTDIFNQVALFLKEKGFSYTEIDDQRPWGGFYVIDDTHTRQFIETFFKDQNVEEILQSGNKLSPKILIIQPNEILSWQWHERRGELWSLVAGQAGFKSSSTDEEPEEIHWFTAGKTERIAPTARHRLVGSTQENPEWGIVAEIWEHSDPAHPSNEEDNHRLKDKYSRT